MPRLIAMLACIAFLAASGGALAGDARQGAKLVARDGCGACHRIRGIANARGRVGPPLDNIGARTIVAGLLPNTHENMVRWLRAPQSVVPGNAMPDIGLSERDADDIATYLEALK